MMVITAIFCLIGVVLWITVGAVVNNPPNDSKCTIFPFPSSLRSLHGTRGESNDDVGKIHPLKCTTTYNYAIAKSGLFVCVSKIIMHNVSLVLWRLS